MRKKLRSLAALDSVHFWVTNRIPRVLFTRLVGQISTVRSVYLTRILVFIWSLFAKIDRKSTVITRYSTLRSFFVRPLIPGARPLAEYAHWVFPCDAIVGAHGKIEEGEALQIKDMPYVLSDLFLNTHVEDELEQGCYLTLRITSGMYHRFHAPTDLVITQVDYISGDVFNVSPRSLQQIPFLFCKNERVVITCERTDATGQVDRFYLVAVGAVLVASVRLHCLEKTMNANYFGPTQFTCNHAVKQGEEIGWFELGSTILILWPYPFQIEPGALFGQKVEIGQALPVFET